MALCLAATRRASPLTYEKYQRVYAATTRGQLLHHPVWQDGHGRKTGNAGPRLPVPDAQDHHPPRLTCRRSQAPAWSCPITPRTRSRTGAVRTAWYTVPLRTGNGSWRGDPAGRAAGHQQFAPESGPAGRKAGADIDMGFDDSTLCSTLAGVRGCHQESAASLPRAVRKAVDGRTGPGIRRTAAGLAIRQSLASLEPGQPAGRGAGRHQRFFTGWLRHRDPPSAANGIAVSVRCVSIVAERLWSTAAAQPVLPRSGAGCSQVPTSAQEPGRGHSPGPRPTPNCAGSAADRGSILGDGAPTRAGGRPAGGRGTTVLRHPRGQPVLNFLTYDLGHCGPGGSAVSGPCLTDVLDERHADPN